MRKPPQKSRRGFALVMALVLVALAVATLSRIAGRGVALVLEARTRGEQLQSEWAARSCRLVLLENAEGLFGDSDAESETAGIGWPYPSQRHGGFRIGDATHRFLLTDEQAKLNLNAVYELQPTALPAILAEAQNAAAVPLRRDAAAPVRPLGGEGRLYDSWGRVVDLDRLWATGANADPLVNLASQLSISEDGKLNVRRATDDALRRTAQLVLTAAEAEKLVEARKGFAGELRDWLAAVDLPSRRVVPLRRLLTDRSSAYTLWVWSDSSPGVTMSSVGETRGQTQARTLQWP